MKRFTLVGVDGNAFCVMGYVANAMKKAKMTREEISEYQKDAMSSDYNHLLAVSAEMIEIVNETLESEGVIFDDEEDDDEY
jgi:hypothetical protein